MFALFAGKRQLTAVTLDKYLWTAAVDLFDLSDDLHFIIVSTTALRSEHALSTD